MAIDRGKLLLIPATAWHGCVERTRAHERLWLTDGDVSSSSVFILKLRTCGALQSGAALSIHTGDSVAWPIQGVISFSVVLQCRGHKVAHEPSLKLQT